MMYNRRMLRIVSRAAQYAMMTAFAAACIVPFYWMVITSLKTDAAAVRIPPEFFPWPLYFEHYGHVLIDTEIIRGLLNSLVISGLSVFGVLVSASMAAYSFSRIEIKGKKMIFGIIIATMLIPGQVTQIPLYVMFSRLGWVDTYLPLIVPQVLINAYGVFMIHQFMQGIPQSYDESAKLDGAGHFVIYTQIVLPLCKPSLIVLGLFNFIGNWNNFMGPLIYLSDESLFPVPLVISMLRDQYTVQWGLMMAASTIAVLPIAILYFIAQRFFVEGIALSGLKN